MPDAITDGGVEMVEVHIMGQRHRVPASLTIMKALEYAGYRLVRGVGCRGGFCGACGTVYRVGDDYRLRFALACQTVVEDGMYLTQIPFYPTQRPDYDFADLEPTGAQVLALYPELIRCFGCNTCTKACPQDLAVMDYVSDLIRGDLAAAADKSFDCIMCGLCVSRCPTDLAPPNAALLARRLYARDIAPRAQHLAEAIAALQAGRWDAEIAALKAMPEDTLKQRYAARTIEP
ncbi:MAG: hypothetical protein Kow00120_02190 [Anaerolineae bacterium]